MAGAALNALGTMLDPMRLAFLSLGVVVGLVVGVIPGIGGLVGLTILLPFTYGLDPFTAVAMLLGVTAVTTTSDTIPAVLFGVPGTVGSAATVLDGLPMAQRGEASRALGASFAASTLGGLFGALILGLSIPMLRPFILGIATPELLALCVFGLTLVAAISGGNALKGVAAACVGILLACVGEDPQAGEMRWTFGSIYLWDGLPLVPVALGLFALPELADLFVRRTAIAADDAARERAERTTQLDGVRDVLRHPFLFLRCSGIGALLGAVPGIGTAIIGWVAYGHAARTEKGAGESFGKGDIRGVIASESSNNATDGGALVPTIAFGVPGSASMAILLGAFTLHGIVPGPQMLGPRLDMTYSMVWSLALANLIGATICFLGARQLAKLALVRPEVLVPTVIAVAFLGALQATKAWEDLYLFLGAGLVGFAMKRLGWARPPLLLGFVLGELVERYAFISVSRYGAVGWMLRPMAGAVMLMALWGLLSPLGKALLARRGGQGARLRFGWFGAERPLDGLAAAAMLALFVAAWVSADGWSRFSALAPKVAATTGGLAALAVLLGVLFVRIERAASVPGDLAGGDWGAAESARAWLFFAWLGLLLAAAHAIGVLPAVGLVLLAWLGTGARLPKGEVVAVTAGVLAFGYGLFHTLLGTAWPEAAIGDWLPGWRAERALRLF
jgi:TctA family transporter